MQSSSVDSDQALRVYAGLAQWKGGPIAGTPEALGAEMASGIPSAARQGHLRVADGYDRDRSPLYYLLGSVGMLPWMLLSPAGNIQASSGFSLLAALPQIFFGLMLGASLWYVTRRLYGNTGGFIALGFYCFSPAMIIGAGSAQSLGEMGGVWGAFGTVFTAIAVAHTLYAPREVVLWNWRRILLLGLSMALAVGNQFSLAFLLMLVLPLMMWVAPVRRQAVGVIWATAVAVATVVMLATYCFKPELFWIGMRHAIWFDFKWEALRSFVSYSAMLRTVFSGGPPLMIALPAALITYAGWNRARYFGNAAPLFMACLFIGFGLGAVDFPGQGFHLIAIIFLFAFAAGVSADLLQTECGIIVGAGLWGLILVSAMMNMWRLARLS